MKEIERRISVPVDEADHLEAKLTARGVQWRTKNRFMMDFSNSLEDRQFTCTLRMNSGKLELMTKTGGAADLERQESRIVASNDMSEVIDALAILGFKKASCGIRLMKECVLEGIEYSIRRVIDINNPADPVAVNLEVEMAGDGGVEALDKAVGALGFESLSKEEAIAMFKEFHKKYNADFEYSAESRDWAVALAQKWAA